MAIEYDINLGFDTTIDETFARAVIALGRGAELLRSYVTPLVPVETGNLAGSGGITVVDSKSGPTAELLYPGPYALYQHEGVYYRHGRFGAPLTHTHGESFFLERPIVEHGEEIINFMGDIVMGRR